METFEEEITLDCDLINSKDAPLWSLENDAEKSKFQLNAYAWAKEAGVTNPEMAAAAIARVGNIEDFANGKVEYWESPSSATDPGAGGYKVRVAELPKEEDVLQAWEDTLDYVDVDRGDKQALLACVPKIYKELLAFDNYEDASYW